MTTIIGIDPSLTGAGVCVLRDGEPPEVQVIRSKPIGNTIPLRSERLHRHLTAVLTPTGIYDAAPALIHDQELADDPMHFVIEAPSYGSVQGAQHDRSGFWWLMVSTILMYGHHCTEVPPTTLKKFATGQGNADKDQMVWVTARQFPVIAEVLGNDQVDALWLATLGRYRLDPDLAGVSRTKVRDAVVKSVHW